MENKTELESADELQSRYPLHSDCNSQARDEIASLDRTVGWNQKSLARESDHSIMLYIRGHFNPESNYFQNYVIYP